MIIRKATMHDFNELLKFRLFSKKEELKYSETLKPVNESKKYFEEYLRLDITKPDRVIFIAEENREIVGTVLGKFFKPLRISKFSKKGHMSNLYIKEGYRRKRIAEKLMLKVIGWFKENNVPFASLEIHLGNKAAQNLCRKLGFKNYTMKMVKKV